MNANTVKIRHIPVSIGICNLPGDAISDNSGATYPGRLGPQAPELSDIASPGRLHIPIDTGT